ncbi:MAG: hypothetical protein V1727_02030 [Candidatus Omnitrophota bacterium]
MSTPKKRRVLITGGAGFTPPLQELGLRTFINMLAYIIMVM